MLELAIGPGRAIWTDRHGGVSEAPYDTANLGDHVGDALDAVFENRERVAASLDLPAPQQWAWLRQVHGCSTAVIDETVLAGAPTADAAVTTRAGVPLVVLTADCASIALATDDAIGVVHAGWMGLLAGVVETAVAQVRSVGRGSVRAVLGPCIHPARYEFGRSELEQLVARFGSDVAARTDDGKPAFDLPAGVRAALLRAEVSAFDDLDVCTAASVDYFSHRRDGVTGRQAVVVVRDA